MELVSVRLENFRRFRGAVTLQAGPPVLALVGPNNVGKSSLLHALAGLSKEGWEPHDAFEVDAATSAATGPELSAMFAVDAADREALSDRPGIEQISHYTAGKHANGKLWARIDPMPEADQRPRKQLQRAIDQVPKPERPEALQDVRKLLMSDVKVLTSEQSTAVERAEEAWAAKFASAAEAGDGDESRTAAMKLRTAAKASPNCCGRLGPSIAKTMRRS
jgi:energy-coupling factor transporter ATP-binding protein EcfA2